MEITYGNREGRHFTQWRFDDLVMLAQSINERMPEISVFHIWYDADEDYHNLEFAGKDIKFKIRYYKVYALLVDGSDEDRFPYLRSAQHHMVSYIKKKLTPPTS